MKKDEISETEEELDKLFYQFSKIKKAEVLNLSTKNVFLVRNVTFSNEDYK